MTPSNVSNVGEQGSVLDKRFTARLLIHPERAAGLAAEVRVNSLILARDCKALAAPSRG